MRSLHHKPSDSVRLTFLVLRCQSGDTKAFEKLFQLFGEPTLLYLKGMLGPDPADDIHQDVWITVYRKIHTLANPARFKPWLYRITRHRALDVLRKQHRETAFVETGDLENLSDGQQTDVDEIDVIDTDLLQHAVDKLSPAHREVLILRFWENLNYGEIALITGYPIGTIRSRLHHAKRALKGIFESLEQN